MESFDFYAFLALATMLPLAIPFVVMLVDEWILSARLIRWAAVIVAIAALAAAGAIYHLFGCDRYGRDLVGSVPILIACGLFYLFTKCRDGRFLFTTVTVALLITVLNAVISIFVPLGTPAWLVVKIVVTLILLPIFYFMCRAPYLRMLHSAAAGWVWLTLIPLSLLFAINSCYLMPLFLHREAVDVWTAVALCAITPLIYVTIHHFLQSMQEQYRAQQNEAVLVAQIHALEQQTERILSAERMNRIFRHDLRHFLQLLKSSALAGDAAELLKVVSTMDKDLTQLAGIGQLHRYTGSVLIDTVLSLTAAQAADLGVDFTVSLTVPEDLPVDMTEFAVVLSNALENALNACSCLPPETLRCIRVVDGGCMGPFFLAIENTISAPVAVDLTTGLPTTDRPDHGYGAKSIAAFAEKYHAVLDYQQTKSTFALRLLFPK